MGKSIDDFCLGVISNIQKDIIDYTEFLNDNDTIDIYTFVAHWFFIIAIIRYQKKGEKTMGKSIDDFCLGIISNIQKDIIDYTEFLNDNDTIDIYTFVAHWLLTEVTVLKKGD